MTAYITMVLMRDERNNATGSRSLFGNNLHVLAVDARSKCYVPFNDLFPVVHIDFSN